MSLILWLMFVQLHVKVQTDVCFWRAEELDVAPRAREITSSDANLNW